MSATSDARYLLQTPAERRQSHIDSGATPYSDWAYTGEAAIQWLKDVRRYDAAVEEVRAMAEAGDERARAWVAANEAPEEIPQDETRITKERDALNARSGYGDERSVQVEQVIAPDGQPAVRVRTWKIQWHAGVSSARQCLRDTLMRFPRRAPVGGIVGQWADKEIGRGNQAQGPNNDPATYVDYWAWDAAFTEVYSRS